jgi:hypothetical protein
MQIHNTMSAGRMVVACVLACWQTLSVASPVLHLEIGKLKIRQQEGAFIQFDTRDGKSVRVDERAGAQWPPIVTDSEGMFYIGDKILSSRTGRLVVDEHSARLVILGAHYRIQPDAAGKVFRITHGAHSCVLNPGELGLRTQGGMQSMDLLKNASIRFVDANGPLVGLITLLGDSPADTRYRAVKISIDSCHVVSSANLGNPDNLVDLGWSEAGHWWIVGSIENTLLLSNDGEHWSTRTLPDTVSELVSAYVENDQRIWLAAIDSRLPLDAGPLIVFSSDGGKTWTPLKWGDPLIREVPSFWLDGQMRTRGKETD